MNMQFGLDHAELNRSPDAKSGHKKNNATTTLDVMVTKAIFIQEYPVGPYRAWRIQSNKKVKQNVPKKRDSRRSPPYRSA
jgi:hypothetical protein